MACKSIDLGFGMSAIVCGLPRIPKCSVPGCDQRTVALCDWKLTGKKAGKTCSAKLCARHTTKPTPEKDLCPAHAAAWAEWKKNHPQLPGVGA